MTRSPNSELRLRRGTWSPEEDQKLMAYVQRYGHWNWNYVPIFAGLSRSGKSCRLRWKNYLRPNLRHGNFSIAEVEVIKKMQHELGNKWSTIASKLPGRTDNDIKNYWNTRLRKQTKHESSSSSSGSGNDTFKNSPERSDDHFKLASNNSTSESSNSVGFGLEEIIQMPSPQLSNLSYNSFSSFDQAESDASSTINEAKGAENMITSDISDEWFVRLLEEPFQCDPLFDDNGTWQF